MATVLSLFPSENSASTRPTKKPRETSEPASIETKVPLYLKERGGVYYFKRKIPASLVSHFGNQAQIWKSLNTKDFSQACRELAKEVAAFELRVATVRLRMASEGLTVAPMLNVKELSEDMIPALVQRYYVHMLEREDQELRSVPQPLQMAELAERKADADEMLRYYQLALACSDVSVVEETASQILAGEGLRARAGSSIRKRFCEKLLATEVDILREQRARLDGNRRPTPEMPLPIRLQPTLTDYLEEWATAKVRPVKTVETTSRIVRLWTELIGEMPASTITRSQVIEFRNKLMEQQLSAATIRNRLGLLRAVVNTYFEEKNVQGGSNPFDKIPVKDKGQRMRIEKDRRAFEMSEFNTIYSAPLFTGKQVPKGQVAEAAYWATLMGPFVGARIEEIAQMRMADIEILNGVWTFRICDLDKTTQDLKTINSFRRVPIHEEIIKLGFLQYLCDAKRRGVTRVFPSLESNNKYGRWSNALGKWFGRFLHQLALTSPQLDYHSFRYHFKQRLTQCGVNDEVRDALSGHWLTKEKAGKVYMKGANQQYSFPSLCNAMQELRYEELDLSALYVNNPWEGVDSKLFVR